MAFIVSNSHSTVVFFMASLCVTSHVCMYYKVFKPEYHRSESFEFGNMYSERKQCTSNDKEQVTSTSEVFNLESTERDQIQGNHGLNKVEEREIVLGHCENAPKPLCKSPRRYDCLYC